MLLIGPSIEIQANKRILHTLGDEVGIIFVNATAWSATLKQLTNIANFDKIV